MGGRDFYALCCTEVRIGSAYWNDAMHLRERMPSPYSGVSLENNCSHLVCFFGDQLAGCAIVQRCVDGAFRLVDLIVEPEQQGKGVGTCLLAFVENFARARSGQRLLAYASQSFVAFYSKAGFQIEGAGTAEKGGRTCLQLAKNL
jgi:GNAT superfamily N-acetyltransferase